MNKSIKNLFAKTALNKTNIQRECYTMAMNLDKEAEIIFYGEIVRTRPVDWWTGEPIPGNFITLDAFLEDLKSIETANKIVMRVNSLGGDSNTSLVIHNRLKELKAHKIAIIDGAAMSGGTHIVCAADEVIVRPPSQFMIHKCWSYLWGAYNADELRNDAKMFDATDKSQVEIYKAKTGLDDETLLEMMSGPTFLVGQEIVDAGFADKVSYEEESDDEPLFQTSEDRSILFVNGNPMHLPKSAFEKMIKSMTIVDPAANADKTNIKQLEQPSDKEEEITMAKNLEELKTENPNLADALMEEAKVAALASANANVEKERKRIQDIEAISSIYSDEVIEEAKYGKTACSAQELAYREAQKTMKVGTDEMNKIIDDFKTSGAEKVSGAQVEMEEEKPLTPAQRVAAGRANAQKVKNNSKGE